MTNFPRDGTSAATAAALPEATIDRASPVPFYFQLAELLEEEIVSGRWVPGTRVPSENDLGARYGLSRTTIRQALARLEQEGLVSREKGRGTFVSDSRPRSWLIQSTEGFFHDEFLRAGRAVRSRILRLERVELPRWASDSLSLPAGSEGMVVERVRSVDGVVALYVINCLPAFAAEAVVGLQPDESLYQRLVEAGGISVVGGSRSLQAVTAGAKLAKLLEVDAGAALAYIESVTWDETDRPVDCYRAWLRTDRMRLDIQVSAQGAAAGSMPFLVAPVLR
ncbi:MAG: GntR family transcriptional regulator [Solirubrobacterales bacterium]|nr:GntR family transcriptional regulator [Solirubrobacterales bacterium]